MDNRFVAAATVAWAFDSLFWRTAKMQQVELQALVRSVESGNDDDRKRLFDALYSELHRVAQRELRRNAAVTLSPTTLLHETFLSMSRDDRAKFPDRGRFMAYAGCAMRGLLIDYLRARQAQKRGAKFEITSLPVDLPAGIEDIEGDQLGAALDELAQVHPRLAECVDLKFFCGLSYEDIAKLWQVSERTVQREWEKARIMLFRSLKNSADR
jgi:RNA polymerase sigma factor (TIGR02999 family)